MSRGNPTLDRRQLLRIFGAVAAAGATAGFASACTSSEASSRELAPSGLTIRVGVVLPSAGPFAHIGEEIRRGFSLYLENNANMLGPHEVELLLEDEGADAQSALAGSLLAQPVVVRVNATDGLPMAGVTVNFAAQNGGSVGTPSAVSGADGLVQTTWTLGPGAGAQTLTATAVGATAPPRTS